MDSKAFVELVEKELKVQKISKAAFYDATGISSASFSQWRNGIYSPSSANIKSIESFLGVSFHLSTKEKSPTSNGVELTEEDMKHLEAFHAADEDTKAAIRLLLAKYKAERG